MGASPPLHRSRWRSASVSSALQSINLIEKPFAKLKALREAAARSVEDLWTRIGECLPAFSPNECKNYFAAAGYDAK
jgi:hypothetical protein